MTITPVELHHIDLKRACSATAASRSTSLLDEIAESFEEVWRQRADFADRIEQLQSRARRAITERGDAAARRRSSPPSSSAHEQRRQRPARGRARSSRRRTPRRRCGHAARRAPSASACSRRPARSARCSRRALDAVDDGPANLAEAGAEVGPDGGRLRPWRRTYTGAHGRRFDALAATRLARRSRQRSSSAVTATRWKVRVDGARRRTGAPTMAVLDLLAEPARPAGGNRSSIVSGHTAREKVVRDGAASTVQRASAGWKTSA